MLVKKRVRLGANIVEQVDSRGNQEEIIKLNYLFKTQEDDRRPYLDVRIFGASLRALLDSGASHTVLGEAGLWIMDKFPARLKTTPKRWVETADSNRHEIKGFIELPITLEGRTKSLRVLVVPSLKQNLILGIDFWEKMQLVADVHHRSWDFASSSSRIASLEIPGGIKSEEHLSPEEKLILKQFIDTEFGTTTKSLGRTNLVEHIIDTGDSAPIKQRYYPLSPARLQLVHQELDKMLELGVVVPSKSPWSSPIILLDKPDGSKRFVVDFRKVNAVTKRDAYPLPQVTTILDRLRDARYLSSLDVKSAYWQIPLATDSQEKTAFTVPGRGLYHFKTMPFGLHNAPATWQRFIDNVIGADLEPQVFVYLDDIIVVTKTFQEHLNILRKIFQRLKAANVTLNPEKCCLCRAELRYLGYIVNHMGLRVDPSKVEAIINIPVPTNQKTVRQFCGTASWYRRFIPNFASRLYPLTQLLKKRQQFVWTPEAQEAFEDIRSCLVKAPILTCPDFTKPFEISCDASGIGIGAVLSQVREQGEQVVAYASRTLTRAEQKYSATERECLAVIWAVERFRPYIEGTHFKIITDHYSLLWLHNLKDPQGRLARWALRLQPYSFTLIHRKGKDHVVPDLLSRSMVPEEDKAQIAIISDDISGKDRWYQRMCENVRKDGVKYPAWRVENGSLWKFVPNNQNCLQDNAEWKKVVPKYERAKLLAQLHDAPTAGHLGSKKTLARVQEHHYWPKMRKDICTYVSRCRTCQQSKDECLKPSGFMGERRGVNKPWIMLAADLMGPFPRSSSGFKYLLVVTDTFTKFPLLFPLRAATATSVAKHLENDVFLIFGIPKYVICDNGSEFSGRPVKTLAAEYKVKILYNASRHPQANPVERINKTLGNMLRSYVKENHRLWDKDLAKFGFALRSARHEATGYTPSFLNFGREMNLNVEVSKEDTAAIPEILDNSQYGAKLKDLQKIYNEVGEKLSRTYNKNAERYNLRRRHIEFKEQDRVWKRSFAQSDATRNFAAKLAPRFNGPYIISKRISPLIYELQDEKGKVIGNWHIADLKRYTENI